MIEKDIELTRGDTLCFDVTISEIDGVTIESMYFSMKKKRDGDEYLFKKSIGDGITLIEHIEPVTPSDPEEEPIPESFKYRVRVAPEDTWKIPAGKYYHDLQVGLGADIYTPMKGKLELTWDVTEEIE